MINISVVIPCKNEVNYIEECIRAIFSSELPKNIQLNVLVVDGMSTDGTRDIVNRLIKEFSNLKLLNNEKELTPYAFNIGTHETDFDFLQIVGARHIISSNYIYVCFKKIIANDEIWCAGGRIENSYINSKAKIIAEAMSTSFGMGLGNFRTLKKTGFTDTVTSPMYPKSVFDEIGYFDERLTRNQDDDFNYRVLKSGGKILFINEIHLKYYVRASLKNLKRQFYQYGYWKVYVNKKHKAITTFRQLVPLFFVLFLFLLPISFYFQVLSFFIFLPITVLYLTLVLIFGVRLIEKSEDTFTALLAYPSIHISYGLGYLVGIFHFILLNKAPSPKHKRLSR